MPLSLSFVCIIIKLTFGAMGKAVFVAWPDVKNELLVADAVSVPGE